MKSPIERPFCALPRSDVPGIVWPAIPRTASAPTFALLHQLEQTQWWTSAQLAAAQRRQLGALLRHAYATSTFWRERIADAGIDIERAIDHERFRRLPLLDRATLQHEFARIKSNAVPADHGTISEGRTSGSTGMPLSFLSSQLERLFWDAFTVRDALWHKRDFNAKFCVLREHISPARHPNWGAPFSSLFTTGPAVTNRIEEDVDKLLEWLIAENPRYLAGFPTVIRELAVMSIERGVRPTRLREVSCLSELLPEDARARVRQAWDAAFTDIYSAAEAGYIALQCPRFEHYHVQAENCLVEILDEAGETCKPGEIGRVVLTPLHKFALPLLRYDIGDYAEQGEPCACGRGLPVLNRIIGRTRNLVRLPDGKRFFPVLDTADWYVRFGARQLQLIQSEPERVEIRIVTDAPVDAASAGRIGDFVRGKLRYPFRTEVVRCERIERNPSSRKYEYFICTMDR